MFARAVLVALGLLVGSAWAANPPPSAELFKAYRTALDELCGGNDRQDITDRLQAVSDKYPATDDAEVIRSFLLDLTASAKSPSARPDDPPEKRLADTRVPFYLLKYAENWGKPLTTFLAKEPNDPIAHYVAADRAVIARLIPLLTDRTPTRCANSFGFRGPIRQPRVCDLALAVIEYQGKVRFHHDTIRGTYLHQLPGAECEMVAERVATWWSEVKDKSVAAGVRAQLMHGRSYPETVWMAKTLGQVAEGQKTDDREFALDFLREMVKQNCRNHVGGHAADALAELGDKSAVDIFHDDWKSALWNPGLKHDGHIVAYLCSHGGRREWELLHAISLQEIGNGIGPKNGAAWASVVNSGVAGTNPYAIPILGLALGQVENTGVRWLPNGPQPISYADTACELFQRQVGKDFGYKSNATAAERAAAIMKAWTWWDAEGKAKYSFDYIEKEMVPAKAPPTHPDSS